MTSDDLEEILVDILTECAQQKPIHERERFLNKCSEILAKYKISIRAETLKSVNDRFDNFALDHCQPIHAG